MISGVNGNNYIQNVCFDKPAKQQNIAAKGVTNSVDNMMNGLEALGIYNMNLVRNKEQFEHKPIERIMDNSTALSDIQGEKMTDPYGKLEYIAQKDNEFETRYYPSDIKGEEDEISRIEIRDIETGKLLKTQCNADKGRYVYMEEYPKNEPNTYYTTSYEQGEVVDIGKIEILPNGLEKYYSKTTDANEPCYSAGISDRKHNKNIDVNLDSNGMVKSIDVSKKVGNTRYNTSVVLNNGAIITVDENKNTVVPNYMERNVLNDLDVQPAKKFNKDEIEQLAKNSPDSNLYSFNGNGTIKEYYDGKTKIEFEENGTQIIKEYYDKDKVKTTTYDKNGSINVIYKNGDLTKELFISEKNKPMHYWIEQNGKCIKSVHYTEEGYLSYTN